MTDPEPVGKQTILNAGADSSGWVIFDIDGTVSDCRPRLPYLGRPQPDWSAFFAASGSDAPLHEGIALALKFAAMGTLMWFTGRPARYRELTEQWLHAQGLPTSPLHMRPEGDMRPAAHSKADIIARIAANHRIRLIVDDEHQVVTTLREAGWPVHHATWMSG